MDTGSNDQVMFMQKHNVFWKHGKNENNAMLRSDFGIIKSGLEFLSYLASLNLFSHLLNQDDTFAPVETVRRINEKYLYM